MKDISERKYMKEKSLLKARKDQVDPGHKWKSRSWLGKKTSL